MQPRNEEINFLTDAYHKCRDKVLRHQMLLEERELLFEQMQTSPHLKTQLREMDHQLDAMDAYSEMALGHAKNDLLQAFQIHFPERASEYSKLESTFQSEKKQLTDWLQTQKHLLPLLAILQHKQQKPKILDYITGKHPKIILARRMQQATTYAERALPHIKDETIGSYLRNFLFETKQRCNNALFKGKFYVLAETFFPLMGALDKKIQYSKLKIAELENALESWFD